MLFGGRRVLVPLLTVLVSGFGVRLGLFVLAHVVEMGGLVMMVGRSVMMCGRLMVMLTSRMLVFCHDSVPSDRFEKSCPALASTDRGSQPQVLRLAALCMQRDLTLGSGNYRYMTGAARETPSARSKRAFVTIR